ncbi:MAG TPA: DUF1579 family protein, partial [Terriglobales bacterium]|nr:DUF1579 family protein [Terriglobales bacterium]
MKRSSACFLIVLFSLVFAIVPASPQSPRLPSPELKKQDFFAGKWRLEGITKPSSFGPGDQKFESREDLEWMPGGFFLLAHSYSDGKLEGVTIIGYDEKENVFTHTTFESSGRTEVWKGTAQNDNWTWTRAGSANGKPVKVRLAIKKIGSDAYSFTQ